MKFERISSILVNKKYDKNGCLLRGVKNETKFFPLKTLKQVERTIKYITDMPEIIRSKGGSAALHIKNQTQRICFETISEYKEILVCVKNQLQFLRLKDDRKMTVQIGRIMLVTKTHPQGICILKYKNKKMN